MDKKDDILFAPVIIPTLCRYEHFKRCIKSLAACTGANNTDIYIGLDFPLKDSHKEGYDKISNFLPQIKGFKNVFIIRHKTNKGPTENTRELLEIVKSKYEYYIYTEDDNEFSPNFLEYINKGLRKYINNPKVIAICGCVEPRCSYKCLDSYNYNAYPIKGFNAWGVGIWFDKKPIFDSSKDKELFSLKTFLKVTKFNHEVTLHRLMFKIGKLATGDLRWRLYCIFNNKYCIFPKVSKVRNWGFDGSGDSSTIINSYKDIYIDKNNNFKYDEFEIKDYPEIKKIQNKLYGLNGIKYFIFFLEYIYFHLSNGKCFQDFALFRKIMALRINYIYNNKLK